MIEIVARIFSFVPYFVLLIGLFFCITGALGLVRMPDFFTKMHAIGVSDSCGVPLSLLSLVMINGINFVSFKIILIILLIYIYSPIVCLEVGSAYNNSIKLGKKID